MSALSIIAPSLLLSLTIFLFGTSQIILTNSKEFSFLYQEVFPFILIISVILSVIISVSLMFIKKIFHKLYFDIALSLVTILGILLWLQGNIFVGNYGVLDGKPIDWSIFTYRYYINTIIWLFLLFYTFEKYKFINKNGIKISLFLISIQFIYTIFLFTSVDKHSNFQKYKIDETNKFTYSKKQNVIILLLDTFQTDIFSEVMMEKVEYKNVLDGFLYFPDTLSSYPSTFLSVPTIFTGSLYKNQLPIQKYVDKEFSNNSLFKALKNSDYINEAYTPDGKAVYFNNKYIDNVKQRNVKIIDLQIINELPYLLDVTFFRYSPDFFKKAIYNNQKWMLKNLQLKISEKSPAKATDDKIGNFFHSGSLNFIKQLPRKIQVKDLQPMLKYYHLMGVHAPFQLTEDLKYFESEMTVKNYKTQMKAMISLINLFLTNLKEKNIYDNSLIIILGDHGGGWSRQDNIINLESIIDSNNNLIDYNNVNSYVYETALPLLLIKPINSRGKLKTKKISASLTDIPKTILSSLKIKNDFLGVDLLNQNQDLLVRKRMFYNYKLDDFNWLTDYPALLEEYAITGNAWLSSSWNKTMLNYLPNGKKKVVRRSYIFGQNINFSKNGNGLVYEMGGWFKPEDKNTWMIDRLATLKLEINRTPESNVLLKIRCGPFQNQEMFVYINKKFVGKLNISEPNEYNLIVDKENFRAKETYISFVLPNLGFSPFDLGIGTDPRRLGVSFENLSLSEIVTN